MNRSESIRKTTGMSRTAFCKKYNIPLRTVEAWDAGDREAPDYVMDLLERVVAADRKEHKRYSIINMSLNDYNKEFEQSQKDFYSFDYDYIATSNDKYEIAMILYRDNYNDTNACIEIYTVDDDGDFKEGSDVDTPENFLKNISNR